MVKQWIQRIDLQMENVALFREYHLSLNSGEVIEASGGNGKGKSTLLNALMINLTGKGIAEYLTTYGTERSRLETSIDGLLINRVIEDGKTTDLEVIDHRGMLVKKPQTVLNSMFGGGIYLDPVDLVEMRPADRAKAVAAALDIDPTVAAKALEVITGSPVHIDTRENIFPVIAETHDSLYEKRRQKRNDFEAAEAQADGVLTYLPADWLDAKGEVAPPVEPHPLGDIYDKKSAAEARNAERVQVGQSIAELEGVITRGEEQIAGYDLTLGNMERELQKLGGEENEAEIEQQILILQAKLSAMKQRNLERAELSRRIETARQAIDQNKGTLTDYKARLDTKKAREKELGGMEDTAALQSQIDQHEGGMLVYREALKVHGERTIRYQQAEQLRQHAADLRAEWEALETRVKAIDQLPIELLQGVQMPIDGMVISGEDIFLPDGDKLLNLDAFGEADKYRYCAQLAMALAPVNIILMDGVERCDTERRAVLYQLIADAGFVGFSTCVTGGPLDVKTAAKKSEGPDWTTFPEPVEN